MQKWEYLHAYVSTKFNILAINGQDYYVHDELRRKKYVSIHDYIVDAGINGWELVAMAFNVGTGGGYTYCFKRPLAE